MRRWINIGTKKTRQKDHNKASININITAILKRFGAKSNNLFIFFVKFKLIFAALDSMEERVKKMHSGEKAIKIII